MEVRALRSTCSSGRWDMMKQKQCFPGQGHAMHSSSNSRGWDTTSTAVHPALSENGRKGGSSSLPPCPFLCSIPSKNTNYTQFRICQRLLA